MAKSLISTYIFNPGLGISDNLFPNAYNLISANKAFIQKEATAYITDRIANAGRYTPTAATYTPTTGIMELTIGAHTFNAGDAIIIEPSSITFTCELDNNATLHPYPRATGVPNAGGTDPFFNKAIQILDTTLTTITVNVGISSDTSTHTFVSANPNAVVDTFYNYTNTSQAKCERDIGYVIDAYLTDLRYSGNEVTRNTIHYYWDQTVAQVDGNRGPEIAAHNFISRLVQNFILPQIAYPASNIEVTQALTGSASETSQQFTPTGATYRPTTGDMTLTLGSHSLSVGDEIFIAPNGITFTCSLDGNATLHPYPRASGVPNDTGKDPFYYAPIRITAVTATTVTVNVGISSDTSTHTFVSALPNAVTAGPGAKINTLAFTTVDVIANGLTALPTLVPHGLGSIKIQGKYELKKLLLITNVTKNVIIYNFSDPAAGGAITIKDDGVTEDEDFRSYLQTTDGITTIKLNKSTAGHDPADVLQIFVEEIENGKSIVTTRPYDFGTDAIERMRIATPMSMLDADFEYGLQPTKWAAIAVMRGYPSVYEIPGTDTPVSAVVTDASVGSEGVGASLITVFTLGPHGFTPGTPITIKALEDSVVGAARAEGSFVIVGVPTNNSFTYFAKAKVGTSSGQVLSTTYTQLRKAGFYTGADIGTPAFEIASNGSNGSMTAQLNVAVGSTIIPFDGAAPEVGSPLTNDNIPLGSQVTGILDTSAGGGTYITGVLTANSAPGDTRAFLESTDGIVDNLAVDRGDGTAIYINDVQPTYVDFDGTFTGPLVANKRLYLDIAGTNVEPIGVGATFDVVLTNDPSSSYAVSINNPGTDYRSGNKIRIDGLLLGGQSVVNDLVITIGTVGPAGEILTISSQGAHWDGTLNLTGVSAQLVGGAGSGAKFDLAYDSGAYVSVTPATGIVTYTNPPNIYSGVAGNGAEFDITRNGSSYSVTITAPGLDYVQGESFDVPGSFLEGTSPDNDATIQVSAVGVTGEILSATISGTAFNTADASTGYIVNDTLFIPGSQLDGIDGFSDVYITVSTVDGGGAITAVTFSGTPPNVSRTFNGVGVQIPVTYSGTTGINAVFQVTLVNGFYAVSVQNPGQDYLPTETITVAGNFLEGTSPTNDLTITIDNVDGFGGITAVTATGAGTTAGSFEGEPATNRLGLGASFDVSINAGNYVVALNNGGSDYGANQQLNILGSLLSGATPTNDITITINSVDATETGTITSISSAGTPATPGGSYSNVGGTNTTPFGTDATFDVNRNFDAYQTVAPNNPGANYQLGDIINIPGTNFDGVSPDNDITVLVTQIGAAGEVEGVSFSYTSAVYGTNFDLISTVTMTEATTGFINSGDVISYSALATIETTFNNAHGLVPGSTFITSIASDTGINNHSLVAGSYIATDIPEVNKLRFQVRAPGTIDISLGDIIGEVYPRPDSFFIHRPYDGGVQLGTGGPQHGAQAIRQSKKYIRYQSGKGIMYTTGALFAPSYDLRSLTAEDVEVGSLITVVTDDNDHGVQVGGTIRILGVETPGYNSGNETAVPPKFDYEVVDVVDERTFKIRAQRRLGSTNATLGFGSQMSVVSWHGATVRSGIFDDQNGIFWEFDGTNLSVNQRTGTRQIAGTISLSSNNNLVTGTNTRFRDQLKAGDRIIIKGMTHVVSHVNSQTEITVTPDWRGVQNITGAKANLIFDKKVKQRDFNLDRLDGTGPSGYEIDIAKMQMIGIQYTWYGAGFIDFMLRGSDGNFVFAHRMRNSNVNTEAFMRSGNLPVRYEVSNEGPSGKLAQSINPTQTTLTLEDSSFFPNSGTLYIDNEIITFNSNNIAQNRLGGLVRAATFTNFQAGANRFYTAGPAANHEARTGVVLISQTITPLISHWGSAYITDGGFDEDRGYIFSYAETGVTVSTTKQTAFLIRLAPSVSNAIVGDLGDRELLNRAQLLLQGLEVTSDGFTGATPISGGIVVEGVLNPQNYPVDPSNVGWSELSGVAQGGQPSFAQIASGGSVVWSTGAAATTANATAQANIDASVTIRWNSGNNRNFVYARRDSWEASGARTGDFITASNNASWFGGIQITSVEGPYSSGDSAYYVVRLSRTYSGFVNTGHAITVQRRFTVVNRNFVYLTKASFEASGAKAGTPATGGSATFPANTLVNNVTLETYGGTEYYVIQFNNAFSGTIPASSGTVQFTFEQPPYAQPGETIFSFIAVPGERSEIDFSELKELTNTPLGGRGTFPNGPDVLAINVYKVSGAETVANLILKWGEAQA